MSQRSAPGSGRADYLAESRRLTHCQRRGSGDLAHRQDDRFPRLSTTGSSRVSRVSCATQLWHPRCSGRRCRSDRAQWKGAVIASMISAADPGVCSAGLVASGSPRPKLLRGEGPTLREQTSASRSRARIREKSSRPPPCAAVPASSWTTPRRRNMGPTDGRTGSVGRRRIWPTAKKLTRHGGER